MDYFVIGTQKGSDIYVCAKFEAYIFICPKVIRGGPKISKFDHVTQATPT